MSDEVMRHVCRFCTGEKREYPVQGPMRKCTKEGRGGYFCGCCRETVEWMRSRGIEPELMCTDGERIDR